MQCMTVHACVIEDLIQICILVVNIENNIITVNCVSANSQDGTMHSQ